MKDFRSLKSLFVKLFSRIKRRKNRQENDNQKVGTDNSKGSKLKKIASNIPFLCLLAWLIGGK